MLQALGVGEDEQAKSGRANIGARGKIDRVGGGGTSEGFAGKRFLARPAPASSINFCVRSNLRAARR